MDQSPDFAVLLRRMLAYLHIVCKTIVNEHSISRSPPDGAGAPGIGRAEIAGSLIRSLDNQIDEDADAAWAAEIDRRIGEIDRGEVRLIPWDDVMRELRGGENE